MDVLHLVFFWYSSIQKAMSSRMREAMAEKLKGMGLEDKVMLKWGVGCRGLRGCAIKMVWVAERKDGRGNG